MKNIVSLWYKAENNDLGFVSR